MSWLDENVTLIYDGSCGFCIRSLAVLKRFDVKEHIKLVDSADASAVTAAYDFPAGTDFSRAMYAVSDGTVHRGFDAFRRSFWAIPHFRYVNALLYIPGIPQLGRFIYDLVARNRHSLGCESSVCEIPK